MTSSHSHSTRRLHSILHQLAPPHITPSAIPTAAAACNLCATHVASASLTQVGTRLQNRVAIITGAGSGIGRASAILFARQGASLLLQDLNVESVEETARLIRDELPQAKVATRGGDIAEQKVNEQLVADAVALYGTLHVFFANAGIVGTYEWLPTVEADNFRRTLDVNVVGAFLGMQAAAQYMLTQPPSHAGSILVTSSVAGLRAGAGGIDYSASKAAVISIVQTMALKLAGKNIRVNAVNPGLIETGMTSPLYEMARARQSEHKVGQLNPLRRGGEPHEIAAAALFLASEESSYVNGQAIVVCGGLSSQHPIMPPPEPKEKRKKQKPRANEDQLAGTPA